MADLDFLPEGWTVEVKVRKNGKKDKYYIDPLKGYIFQSRKDVLRYCENGELGKYVKSKDKDIADGEMEDDKVLIPVAKEQSLSDSSPKTEVSLNRDSILNEAVENKKTCESTNPKKSSPDAELIENQCKQSSVTSCPISSESGQKGESSMHNSITDLLGEEIPTDDKRGKNVNGDSKPRLVGKLKCRKPTEFPRRSSKRLAGLQIDQPLEIKTKTRAGGNLETENTTKKLEPNCENQTDLPRRASKRLAGIDIGPQLEQKPTTRARQVSSKSLIDEKVQESSKVMPAPAILSIPGNDKTVEESGLPSEPVLSDIWMDPCFEFAVKTLTDVIPVEDHLKTLQPSEHLWEEDPCIQFAVKTLTGDIPLVDDFGVEEFLRKHMTKNQTGGIQNTLFPAFHSDSSSYLDSMEKNASKQPIMNHSRNSSTKTPVENKIN
ncbi:methyl-CpG-binding domain-containing protein 13-like [Impatiens glandulifera]|uniref:methyl-CpG-binding domain-containing protein 13-like n=1 Tax=Impatiens glandulifera TaxID=253017 RepID=UPI001FB0FB11|nr:methyl-CpG-binding domain-containing protein 13-like [Impatiens glandulifera]